MQFNYFILIAYTIALPSIPCCDNHGYFDSLANAIKYIAGSTVAGAKYASTGALAGATVGTGVVVGNYLVERKLSNKARESNSTAQ
jgi:hypothetical protein